MKRKHTDLLLGLFCTLLFFVANPNGLIKAPAVGRTFMLNVFLFLPYIYVTIRLYKSARQLKKIIYGVLAFIFILEFLLLQIGLLWGVGLDARGSVGSTFILSFFVLLILAKLIRYVDRRG